MKIFMIGGTGLLGSEAAKIMIENGHEVVSIALPPLPTGSVLPEPMKIEFGNYMEMSDDTLRSYFKGCEGFVFAAGVDERIEGPAPIYDMFKKYNIDPVERLLRIAKEEGVKHSVILGSYFTYLNRARKDEELAKWHPYIRSRQDQQDVALSFADENFDVSVVELPYIFGTQPGRKPVWMFLVENIMNMPEVTYYPEGGTAMVTVKQVAQAIFGALTKNKGGNAYPIGYYNLTWNEMLEIVHETMGMKDRKIVNLSKEVFDKGLDARRAHDLEKGVEPGLNMEKFADLQCSEMFIDKSLASDFLGVEEDDIKAAIKESIQLCLDILDDKVSAIGMKAE